MLKKKCPKCGKKRSLKNYHVDSTHVSGLQRYCKKCRRQEASEYALESAYGITFSDKKEMYKEQKGLCGACGRPLPKNFKKAHVDHNHRTGQVRQLLHSQCNFILGWEEDAPGLLLRIVAYRKKWLDFSEVL